MFIIYPKVKQLIRVSSLNRNAPDFSVYLSFTMSFKSTEMR